MSVFLSQGAHGSPMPLPLVFVGILYPCSVQWLFPHYYFGHRQWHSRRGLRQRALYPASTRSVFKDIILQYVLGQPRHARPGPPSLPAGCHPACSPIFPGTFFCLFGISQYYGVRILARPFPLYFLYFKIPAFGHYSQYFIVFPKLMWKTDHMSIFDYSTLN